MLLSLSTWPEVEAYLERSRGVIVPIGSTEQHGPMGLIGTDSICPETIARAVSERIDALVAPTISVGMAQHHLAFPGTIALRPSTLIALVHDVVASLSRHGFEACYFLNGHGGNVATLTAAFSEIHAGASFVRGDRSRVRCKVASWYDAPSAREISRELFGAAEGSHATPSEVSLSWYAHPEAQKRVELSPRVAPTGPIRDAEDYRARFPDGRIGSDTSLASREAGERLHGAVVADVIDDYQRFVGGAPAQ